MRVRKMPRRIKGTQKETDWSKQIKSLDNAYIQKLQKTTHMPKPTLDAVLDPDVPVSPGGPSGGAVQDCGSFYGECVKIWDEIKARLKQKSGKDAYTSEDGEEVDPDEEIEEQDERKYVPETVNSTRMVKLFFVEKGIKTAKEARNWALKHPHLLLVKAEFRNKLSAKFFDEKLLKQGTVPCFEQITLDEAHMIRHPKSTHHICAMLLPKSRLLLSTGTALYNDITDVKGYSSLFAHHCNIDKNFTFKSSEADMLDVVTWSHDLVEEGHIQLKEGHDRVFVKSLYEWANQNLERRQWWSLLSGFRSRLNSFIKPVQNRAANAFLDTFVTTRKMNTPLVLPSGKVTYPSSSLPSAQVRTVEVSHCPDIEKELNSAVDVMYANLHTKAISGTEDGIEGRELSGKHPKQISYTGGDKHGPILNMAIHRLLTLISFDMRNHPLFFDPNVRRKDPLARLGDNEVVELNKLAADRDVAIVDDSPTASDSRARLSSLDVHKLASMDIYGGLLWRYTIMAPPDHTPVDDATHMLNWALFRSPVMLEAVDRVVKAVTTPELGGRALVLVDSSFAQL